MPGKKLSASVRLASNRQLWRLNQLGRLAVVDENEPIDAQTAKELLTAELGHTREREASE
jgi:hypothetical protein